MMDEQFDLAVQLLNADEDVIRGISILTKLAEDGHSKSQSQLGYIYLIGEYVLEDAKEAIKWLTLGHFQNEMMATHNLACMHYYGHGIPVDQKEAFRLYMVCVQKHNLANSALKVAECYHYGEGVDSNPVEAFRWYMKYRTSSSDMTIVDDSIKKLIDPLLVIL